MIPYILNLVPRVLSLPSGDEVDIFFVKPRIFKASLLGSRLSFSIGFNLSQIAHYVMHFQNICSVLYHLADRLDSDKRAAGANEVMNENRDSPVSRY